MSNAFDKIDAFYAFFLFVGMDNNIDGFHELVDKFRISMSQLHVACSRRTFLPPLVNLCYMSSLLWRITRCVTCILYVKNISSLQETFDDTKG